MVSSLIKSVLLGLVIGAIAGVIVGVAFNVFADYHQILYPGSGGFPIYNCVLVANLPANPATGQLACVSDWDGSLTSNPACTNHSGGNYATTAIYDGTHWDCP